MRPYLACLLGLVASWPGPSASGADGDFSLKDADRVVFVGNTFVERDQEYGYLETRLTIANPGKRIVFRNLGWSGDTVFGDARAGFDNAAKGFERLREIVVETRPTVIFVAYGGNEAFEGEAGLSRFREGLNRLMDVLAGTKARLVVLSPPPAENLGPPLPDLSPHNRDLRLYGDVLKAVADERKARFIDLFDLLGSGWAPPGAPKRTDDGLHFTAEGYRTVAALIVQALGCGPGTPRWSVAIEGAKTTALGTKLTDFREKEGGLRFTTRDERLPDPSCPSGRPVPRILRVAGLNPGSYTLKVDGRPVATAEAARWQKGVALDRGPEFDQAEALRKAIVAKNRLFFHRWRPQNETYLFGFRKHEQGQNAKEVAQFDPLVGEKEDEIVKRSVPTAHEYELRPSDR